MIFVNIQCQWDLMIGKNRSSTLRLSRPTYHRQRIRGQKNSDSLCGVFNLERIQIISRSLHKRTPPPFGTRYYWNCEYHKGTLVELRAATDESQKTRNKKQETKRFSTFAVYRLRHSETKKNIA